MTVDFEEKTYESYFNIELKAKTNILFPPGQVQEGKLGFDCSAYSEDEDLWSKLGSPQFDGAGASDIFGKLNTSFITKIEKTIPKVNLLFQYKRPEYITSNVCKEWKSWGKPYFRYEICEKQQRLLTDIIKRVGSNVFVVYAAPSLKDSSELIQAHKDDRIIDSSNFCEVSKLHKHKKNTYTNAGTHSIAFSKPKQIECDNLIDKINSFDNNQTDVIRFIIEFSNAVQSVIKQDKYWGNLFNQLNEKYEALRDNHKLLYSYVAMHNVRLLTGIQWLINTKNECDERI